MKESDRSIIKLEIQLIECQLGLLGGGDRIAEPGLELVGVGMGEVTGEVIFF